LEVHNHVGRQQEINITTRNSKSERTPKMIPAIAMPRPSWWGFCLIWERAIAPSTMLTGPTMKLKQQQQNEKMPVASAQPAMVLVDGTAGAAL